MVGDRGDQTRSSLRGLGAIAVAGGDLQQAAAAAGKSNRITDRNNNSRGRAYVYYYYYYYCEYYIKILQFRTGARPSIQIIIRWRRGGCGRLCMFIRVLNYHIIKRTDWQDFVAAVSHHKGVLYFTRNTPPPPSSRKVARARALRTHSRVSTIN